MCKRCGNCTYCCEVRKHPDYQEILTHVCAYFVVTEHTDYILEVADSDVCECWKQKN